MSIIQDHLGVQCHSTVCCGMFWKGSGMNLHKRMTRIMDAADRWNNIAVWCVVGDGKGWDDNGIQSFCSGRSLGK